MQSQAAVLVVSFGTSFTNSRESTIGAIERAIASAMPQYPVRRAFTSQMILRKLKNRDGLEIDDVAQALERAADDGIQTLIVQPTHMMAGLEYQKLKGEIERFRSRFDQIYLGEPLLTSEEDYRRLISAITTATAAYDNGKTAIVYMGHGSEAKANSVYTILQDKLHAAGYTNYYIGTVEADPSLQDLLQAVSGKGYTDVVLTPLMVVAGDHANNDMAGDDADSWKSVFTKEGYQVTCLLQGLGENKEIQQIYVSHAMAAVPHTE